MVKPHSSNFRVITTHFWGVRKLRIITVVDYLGHFIATFVACLYRENYCSHPSHPHLRSRHTALKFYVQVFHKFISIHILTIGTLEGSLSVQWLLTPESPFPVLTSKTPLKTVFLLCKQFMQIVGQTSVDLLMLSYVSWSDGQHDLYFTAQSFFLISWRLFEVSSRKQILCAKVTPSLLLKYIRETWGRFW